MSDVHCLFGMFDAWMDVDPLDGEVHQHLGELNSHAGPEDQRKNTDGVFEFSKASILLEMSR